MEKTELAGKMVKIEVNRFDSGKGSLRKYVYETRAGKMSSVLDLLLKIKEEKDPTLSIRYSCRMGICGSCGMVINGKPSLACETNAIKSGDTITIEPMRGHPVLKDLVTDFDDFFEKYASIKPGIISERKEKFFSDKPTVETADEVLNILPFASCIKCGLCLDACPVVNTDKTFIGPQALSQAYRYHIDPKDKADDIRLDFIDTKNGVWDCEFAGACSVVCPKGVDPALAIQKLKMEIIKRRIGLLRRRRKSVNTSFSKHR